MLPEAVKDAFPLRPHFLYKMISNRSYFSNQPESEPLIKIYPQVIRKAYLRHIRGRFPVILSSLVKKNS